MIYSNAFAEDYSEKELDTIDKVITLAEKANNDEYDIEYYISNLFDEISLKELMNRLNKVEEKEKQDELLVKIFEETFGGVYREKYFELIKGREKAKKIISVALRYLIIFSIPVAILILFLKLVLNPDFKFLDPLTYVNESNWSKLEFIFTVIELLLIPTALYINSKFGKRLKEWLLKIMK